MKFIFYVCIINLLFFSTDNLLAYNTNELYSDAMKLYSHREYSKAIEDLKKIIEILQIDSSESNLHVSDVYYKISLCYVMQEEYNHAVPYLKKVLNTNNKSTTCKAYISLGNIHLLILDYEKSISYFKAALNILNNEKNIDKQLEWYATSNLGIAYYEAFKYELAIKYYKISIDVAKNNNAHLGSSYLKIANSYYKLNELHLAKNYYNKALEEYYKDSVKNQIRIAWVQLGYGRLSSKIGDREKGLMLLNNALNTFTHVYGKKHTHIASSYYLLGKSVLSVNLNKGLKYFQKSLISKVHPFNDTLLSANPALADIIPDYDLLKFLKAKSNALIKLSETENMQENLEVALNTLELTTQLIEKLHRGFQYEKSRLELLENERKTFSDIIMVSVRLYKHTGENVYKEKAFRYSEKTRYATLRTQMHDMQLAESAGIPDSLRQKEKDIRIKINRFRSAISEVSDKTETDSLNHILFELYEEQDRLTTFIGIQYPRYHQLKHSSDILNIEDIQKKLTRKDAIIEYLLTDTALVSFVLTQKNLQIFCQPADTSFIPAYDEIVKELNRTNTRLISRTDYESYVENAYFLYTMLFKPIEQIIGNKRLIVIPDQSLSFLPLGALIINKPRELSYEYDKLPFLIKKFEINYAFSASLFTNNTNRKWNNTLAAFCPGEEVNNYLVYSKDEVNSISKYFKSDLFIDSASSVSNFKHCLTNYDIVHLSMHTQVDSTNNMIKLVFEPSKNSVTTGKVNYLDIYNLSSNNSLLSLGACFTGNGQVIKGEGVMSLARSFHYAGCRSSITSLMYLKDFSSARILPGFYKHLSRGKRKDVALALAKRKYLKTKENSGNRSHPAFWGGLICIGNPKPVTYPKYHIYGIAGLLFVTVIMVRRKYKKQMK